MCPYTDEQAALNDVLRLARGLTYKTAATGLDLGGTPRASSGGMT